MADATSARTLAPADRYGAVARVLHWAFAVAFLAQFVIYQLMSNLPVSPTKWWFYDLHKSLGLTLLAAIVFRIVWRRLNPPPPLPEGLPGWQRTASRVSHLLLYAGLVIMPVSGFVGSKAGGYKASWFGLLEAPDLFGKNEAVNWWAEAIHSTTYWTMTAVIAVHAGAALMHHYRWRDGVLRRMWP